MISSDLIRGHTDTIILRFLSEKDSYGYEINKNIRSASDEKYELNEATMYTAFKRLEREGYITSYWGDGDTGARRRYYSITGEGKDFYKASLKAWEETSEIIDKLIG